MNACGALLPSRQSSYSGLRQASRLCGLLHDIGVGLDQLDGLVASDILAQIVEVISSRTFVLIHVVHVGDRGDLLVHVLMVAVRPSSSAIFSRARRMRT